MAANRARSVDKPVFKCEQVAMEVGVHCKTLKNWEKEKLILPLKSGKTSIYTVRHVNICKKIKEFSDKGESLKAIKGMIDAIDA